MLHILPDAMDVMMLMHSASIGHVEVKLIVDDPGAADHGQVAWTSGLNTITLDAREIMALALAGDTRGPIASVAWGTGTTPQTRQDPQPAWTAVLQTLVLLTPVISPAVFPTESDGKIASVIFSSTMPPGTGTNNAFSEVGLVSAGGKLFARFTFTPQLKFDRLRLSVNWQIRFS